jgi:hypothetical protein
MLPSAQALILFISISINFQFGLKMVFFSFDKKTYLI